MRAGALLVAAVVAAGATAAQAQSTRYPRPPVDEEALAEARSDFWEEAARPGARRYEHLLTGAVENLRQRAADWTRARELLLEATALRPDVPDAWGYLGVAAERTRDWKACAEAYARAQALAPAWRPTRLAARHEPQGLNRTAAGRPLELGLATCLSRTGELAAATIALEALVARGETSGESWLRLGELYMASGRLAEAIAAFEQARNERVTLAMARWLLAVAHDRARRPGDAEDIAASAGDVNSALRAERLPFVPPADYHYVRAFGSLRAPERALALFRTYLEQAPADSPWRARAQEHVDALAGVDLAARLDLEGTGDRAAFEKAVRAAMPALRRCMAPVPSVLVELRVTQVGPPGKPPPPRRPTVAPGGRRPVSPAVGGRGPVLVMRRPPEAQSPGVRAVPEIFEPGEHDAARNAAVDCVEKVGLGLSLPRPAPGTYSTVRIPVVAER